MRVELTEEEMALDWLHSLRGKEGDVEKMSYTELLKNRVMKCQFCGYDGPQHLPVQSRRQYVFTHVQRFHRKSLGYGSHEKELSNSLSESTAYSGWSKSDLLKYYDDKSG